MSAYEVLKECINIARKADNIPLVENIIEAQQLIVDLQDENYRLRDENRKLKEKNNIIANIERHKNTYISLDGDKYKTIYCSCCYDNEGKLIQLQIDESYSRYWCHVCKNTGHLD